MDEPADGSSQNRPCSVHWQPGALVALPERLLFLDRCCCQVSVWSGRREKLNIGASPPLSTPQYASFWSAVRRSSGTSSQRWTSPAGRMSGPAMPWHQAMTGPMLAASR